MMENIGLLLVPVYLFSIILESVLSTVYKRELYQTKDTFTNIGLGLMGLSVDLLVKGIALGAMTFMYQHALFDITMDWKAWVILFFAQDLSNYFMHLMEHRIRFFWAIHVNHHSSEKLNFSTAVRVSVLQPFYRFWFLLPIAWMGFEPIIILFIYSINQLYQFFLHTETIGKLGPIEWFMNTPSHHRVHHGRNPQYLNKNMGQVLIIWDRIFATFAKEEEEVRFGLTKNINTFNPLKVIFHEWGNIFNDVRRALPISQKLKYVFKEPGWQPKEASVQTKDK